MTLRDQDAEANSLSEWLKDLNRMLREKDAEIASKTELISRCNCDLELLRKEIEHWASTQPEPTAPSEVRNPIRGSLFHLCFSIMLDLSAFFSCAL